MGVNGLWTVVQPCARPTNLATLNRKRLAVDASIWIYQFLKAVRDKEGNALRNSHVVGFFRRICKLLWFGIQPVFVFDGGAPALKRATIQKRQRRREGRRDDAVKTAGKLLAVQMQRLAQEEDTQRRRERNASPEAEPAEPVTAQENLVYVDEIGMSQRERQQNRKFHKRDAYHLPDLDGGIANMGKPDDPRIMSVEELEEYARQFNDGEDVNLYDFSKIDFDGDFFKSLPPPDRYNILNAARLRSRLRMGLSKEQLEEMFPDRMAFSRFQIERVQERNHLTQRLMKEVGMTGTDLTVGVNGRVAGEKNREYILVKNEGVEGGWALGVVSKDKEVGEEHKPIDVDAIDIQYQTKDEEEEEDFEDFEDIPIEGLNRLPKLSQVDGADRSRATGAQQEESLFIGPMDAEEPQPSVHPEEEDDINHAIALSLRNQHGFGGESEDEADEPLEDVPTPEQPEQPVWKQQAVAAPNPVSAGSGSMIAHIVNNRSNAAVPKKPAEPEPARQASGAAAAEGSDSESDEDMQTIMARSRKARKPPTAPKPLMENRKNPFDGPLPFPKLAWGASLGKPKAAAGNEDANVDADDMLAGGFEYEPEPQEEKSKPLPPWLVDETDIRQSVQQQRDLEKQINTEDREEAMEEERRRARERLIEIESSEDEDDDDVQIVELPPVVKSPDMQDAKDQLPLPLNSTDQPSTVADDKKELQLDESVESPVPDFEDVVPERDHQEETAQSADSPEPMFEDVMPEPASVDEVPETATAVADTRAEDAFEDIPFAAPGANPAVEDGDEDLYGDGGMDEFSDPEDEELMEQMAQEAEEHARFASELNQKSAEQNREEYERELRALRNQQKKDRRDADEVTQVMITECQALLRLFGIPYITAPMEAEAQCAELVHLGIVDGIVTDDSDTFLFGGTRVYKNMFNGNKFVECYLGTDLEKELSLSREQLISLSHLLGSDYTEGLPGVGPVTAVEILSEFPGKDGLEHFRDWWHEVQSQTRPKEADASSSFRKKFRKSQAAKLFLPTGFPNPAVYDAYLHPEVDSNSESFQWGVPDVEGLRQFLMATIGWNKERTDEVLVPVIRDMNKRGVEGTQSNITRFFGGPVGVGANEGFAPRHKAQASKRMAAAVDKLRANVDEGSKRRRT